MTRQIFPDTCVIDSTQGDRDMDVWVPVKSPAVGGWRRKHPPPRPGVGPHRAGCRRPGGTRHRASDGYERIAATGCQAM